MLNSLELIGLEHRESPYNFSFLSKEQISDKNFVRPNNPKIIFENNFFAIVYKPSGMPSAPLAKDESNTLLAFFLSKCPEAKIVKGKKEIEAGLVHRLDTPTSGLVLIAKTQGAYDFFLNLQQEHKMEKTYIAISDIDKTKTSAESISSWKVPKKISSQFRPFGPKAKMVAPIFSDERRFSKEGRNYTTQILSIKALPSSSYLIECSLKKGYRHQIRSHLASSGLPIKEDALYNPLYKNRHTEASKNHSYPLQLYAVGIYLFI